MDIFMQTYHFIHDIQHAVVSNLRALRFIATGIMHGRIIDQENIQSNTTKWRFAIISNLKAQLELKTNLFCQNIYRENTCACKFLRLNSENKRLAKFDLSQVKQAAAYKKT